MKAKNRMKRAGALVLAVCLLLIQLPATVSATDADTEAFAIPQDAVYLSTPEDILDLAEKGIRDAWSRDKVFVLENDIDLAGSGFTAIPTFGGTFLGQGYTISGLRLSGEVTAQGFFRYLQKTAVVEDLHLKGTVQPAGSGNLDIGGLVGINRGTVRNCSFTGTVSGTERIGGIAGRNKVSGIIEGCAVSGTVFGDHYIGGIAGDNAGVIRNCVNQARVNTNVDHNSVSVLSGLSLESFTAKESSTDATNIGGIAGVSSGVIRGCENRANVGYEKMGYNVGGIAGSQIGYITECENYGLINGSDGVGGIVGQFKPNVVLNTGDNHMADMMDEMIVMMGSMTGMMGSMEGMMDDMSDNMADMEDAMDMLEDPENLDPDSVQAAISDMSDSFGSMYQDMVASGSKMTGQMETMMGSMTEMVQTMEKLNEGLNIKIIDISKEDTPEDTQAKISNCANFAPIRGENYVGGIVGIADIEDTAAQEDIQGTLNLSTEGEMIMRLVIRDCRNAGTVSVTKQYAGGIVGRMVIGAVFGGNNTGNLDALNANYVGGIAGASETYLADSVSRAILAGNRYVGGIAGFGREAAGCYAISDIAAASKFAGGILGYADPLPDEEAGLVLENRYYLTGTNLGGIDGICYEGATAPMTIEEFLATEGLDDCFRTVSVGFEAEGQEAAVMTVGLGESLALDRIPQLEVGDQEQYQWVLRQDVTSEVLSMGETEKVHYLSQERLTGILFNQTYEARYDTKNTVVASDEKTADGRNLALAVGAFDKGTTLSLTQSGQGPEGISAGEVWQVTVSDIGIEKLHYHIGEDARQILLYVKESDGSWVQRNFTVEGSYMIFEFTQGETAFALEELPAEEFSVAAVALGAGGLVLLLILGKVMKSRKAKKKGTVREG